MYPSSGSKEKIVLAGQSAGAHISMCLMVDLFLRHNSMMDTNTDNKSSSSFNVDNEMDSPAARCTWGFKNVTSSSHIQRSVSTMTSTSDLSAGLQSIKLFVGISGPYNLKALESHLHSNGFRFFDSEIYMQK